MWSPLNKVFTVITLSLSLIACKTASPQNHINEDVQKLVVEKLGDHVDSYPNSTGKYILFIQKVNSSSPTNTLKLIIVDKQSVQIVLEHSFSPGYAKWVTPSSIEVLSVPGTIRDNEDLSDYKKVINIDSKNPQS